MGLLSKTKKKTESQVLDQPPKGLRSRASHIIERVELEESLSLLDNLAEKTGHKKSLRERAKALLTFKDPQSAKPNQAFEVFDMPSHSGKKSLRERAKELLQKITHSFPVDLSTSSPKPKRSLLERALVLLGKKTDPGQGSTGEPGDGGSSSGPDSTEQSGTLPVPGAEAEILHGIESEPSETLLSGIETAIDLSKDELEKAVSDIDSGEGLPADFQKKLFENQIEQLNAIKQVMVQIGDNMRQMQGSFAKFSSPRAQPKPQVLPSEGEFASAGQPPEPESIPIPERRRGGDRRAPLNYTLVDPITQSATPIDAGRIIWPRNVPSVVRPKPMRMNPDGTYSPVPGPLSLPYSPDEILGGDEIFQHFLRNLQNAEFFLADSEYQLSLIIYKRLLQKISNEEIKRKIQENIDSIENYLRAQEVSANTLPYMQALPGQSAMEMAALAETLAQSFSQALQEALSAIKEIQVESMNVHPQGMNVSIDKAVFDVQSAELASKDAGKTGLADSPSNLTPDSSKGGEDSDTLGAEKDSAENQGKGASQISDSSPPGEDVSDATADGLSATADAEVSAGASDQTEIPEAGLESDTTTTPSEGEGTATSAPEPGASDISEPLSEGVMDQPMVPPMGTAGAGGGGGEEGFGSEKEADKVQEIRGVLELKTPDQEDTPFLTLTYDFTKIPHHYRLAKDHNIFEYAYYKYKHMLVKAHHFIKRKQITRALNYYRVIREQQIPDEFRRMIDRNIKDITEYLQKYLTARQG